MIKAIFRRAIYGNVGLPQSSRDSLIIIQAQEILKQKEKELLKQAKRLLRRASHCKQDPHLGLLNLCSTPCRDVVCIEPYQKGPDQWKPDTVFSTMDTVLSQGWATPCSVVTCGSQCFTSWMSFSSGVGVLLKQFKASMHVEKTLKG
ncbi:unnamed protein product [Lepeophtheirus salmonis]|uniref:(salmon louse) hypothetical protein n=1 Tax=Lepeophtheirus salmonis TaxID=72036 RepID=A0A7R8D1X6_LEPSM|nr:unnamed protein product [Lepeophtheirus salmonis]CAF3000199.1 unnamed protein product [Lepeophtheirus salmonis]